MPVLSRIGGGGAAGTYAVVGSASQPLSPKENTIWVNTSVAIPKGKVFFQSTQPSDTTAGAVWFKTGVTASTPVNLLAVDTALVYPMTCYQYVSSAWIARTAQTYQSAAWKDWGTFLYRFGDTCPTLSGGYSAAAKWYSSSSKYSCLPSITYASDHMHLVLDATVGDSYYNDYCGIVYVANPIDLTNASTLCFDAVGYHPELANAGLSLVIWSTFANYASDNIIATLGFGAASERATYSLDVSSITGTKMIGFMLRNKTVYSPSTLDCYQLYYI